MDTGDPPEWHGRFVAAGVLDVIVSCGVPMVEAGRDTGAWCVAPMHCDSLQARLLATGRRAASAYLERVAGVTVRVIAEPSALVFIERLRSGATTSSTREIVSVSPPGTTCAGASAGFDPAAVLTRSEVEALLSDINATFEHPQPFDYGDLLAGVIASCCAAACALVPDVFTPAVVQAYMDRTAPFDEPSASATRVAVHSPATEKGVHGAPEIRVIPNCAIGGDMMAYDYCFETAPSHRRISYPDYNALSPEHHAYWFRHRADPAEMLRRKHRVYLMEALTVPAHEVIHILQGVAAQTDSSIDSFSAEHDASLPAASLAFHVAKTDPTMQHVLGGGAWEAAALLYREHERGWLAISGSDAALFLQVARDFGCGVTRRANANEHRSLESVSKASLLAGLLAYDHQHTTPQGLAAQLRAIFGFGRAGVDTSRHPPAADALRELERARSADRDYALARRSRCTVEELLAVVDTADGAEIESFK